METRSLEPGVLAVFRLFTGLRLIFAVVFTLARLANPDQSVRLIDLVEPAVLMLILSVPVSQNQYALLRLPVALGVAGIGPLLSQAEFLSDDTALRLPIESILTLQTWGSMIVLLLPALIIAWQYRFVHVAGFSLGITLLNVAIILLVANHAVLESPLVASSIMFRFITFIVVGWLVVRMMEAQREQRLALKEANRMLTHHAATLEQLATTRERNRLAREPHDTLAHTLSAVAVQLEAVNAVWSAKPDQAHARLQSR